MPEPLEAVLSGTQRDSLELVSFVFHIIEPDALPDERVIFLDEVILEEKQKDFFLDRLRDISEGTQYIFNENSVHLKNQCIALISDQTQFNQISREIAADFAERHDGQMSAGVFVVAVVSYVAGAGRENLVLLVKMDKRPSFSYSRELRDGRTVAVMTEVPNALSETKNAIQKSAVVEVSGIFAWDVLAFDRVKKPRLADYYQAFLGVMERQNDSTRTRNLHSSVKKWAKTIPAELLPAGEDALTYVGRTFNYLTDNDLFDTNTFLNYVVRDTNPDRKASLVESLRSTLAEAGVAGQNFAPRPDSLPKRERNMTYTTAEGVSIIFQGDKDAAGLSFEDLPDGGKRIIIETTHLTIKS